MAYTFLSVPEYYNPYSGNFVRHASLLTYPTTDYNPYSANLVGRAWPITEFFKSSCSYNSCEGFGHASTH